jgi:hypothetical protein
MGMLLVQLGGLVIAAGLVWVGVQGLRGVPDSTGKKTDKGTAIACLVIAGMLSVGALLAPFLIGRW